MDTYDYGRFDCAKYKSSIITNRLKMPAQYLACTEVVKHEVDIALQSGNYDYARSVATTMQVKSRDVLELLVTYIPEIASVINPAIIVPPVIEQLVSTIRSALPWELHKLACALDTAEDCEITTLTLTDMQPLVQHAKELIKEHVLGMQMHWELDTLQGLDKGSTGFWGSAYYGGTSVSCGYVINTGRGKCYSVGAEPAPGAPKLNSYTIQ